MIITGQICSCRKYRYSISRIFYCLYFFRVSCGIHSDKLYISLFEGKANLYSLHSCTLQRWTKFYERAKETGSSVGYDKFSNGYDDEDGKAVYGK